MDFTKFLINPNLKAIEALKFIDEGAIQLALVVDVHQRLLGTFLDCEIRLNLFNVKILEDLVEQLDWQCAKFLMEN